MAVIRVNKTDNYTVMSNHHLRDKRLTLKAIGLLSKILSLPPDWDYSVAGLEAICKEKRTAVESALKELKGYGYIVVTKLTPDKTESGRIEYVYDVYEQPKSKKLISENLILENQATEIQGVENLGVEFLGVENQEQLNTNKLNKDKLIKEKINDDVVVLSQRLSDKDWEKLDNRYENIVDLIDMIDNQVVDLESIKKPYNYICAIADKQNWERKLP